MSQNGETKSTEYDANFVFPIRDLENARVKLTLFIPEVYAESFVEGTKAYPELYKHFTIGPFDTVSDLVENFIEGKVRPNPNIVLYAVLDKTGESPQFAGLIGLLNTSVEHQCTEIGYVLILPSFQRTHVCSNAVGLLLHYCLELPASSSPLSQSAPSLKYGPGLGLRRVQWRAHAENAKSQRTAQRMGFRFEGIIRWHVALKPQKEGFAVPPERAALCADIGCHVAFLSVCWDDWELEGGRETAQKQMERV